MIIIQPYSYHKVISVNTESINYCGTNPNYTLDAARRSKHYIWYIGMYFYGSYMYVHMYMYVRGTLISQRNRPWQLRECKY